MRPRERRPGVCVIGLVVGRVDVHVSHDALVAGAQLGHGQATLGNAVSVTDATHERGRAGQHRLRVGVRPSGGALRGVAYARSARRSRRARSARRRCCIRVRRRPCRPRGRSGPHCRSPRCSAWRRAGRRAGEVAGNVLGGAGGLGGLDVVDDDDADRREPASSVVPGLDELHGVVPSLGAYFHRARGWWANSIRAHGVSRQRDLRAENPDGAAGGESPRRPST